MLRTHACTDIRIYKIPTYPTTHLPTGGVREMEKGENEKDGERKKIVETMREEGSVGQPG